MASRHKLVFFISHLAVNKGGESRGKNKRKEKKLTEEETKRCLEHFSSHIEMMVCPQKMQIELFKAIENSIHPWKVYKDCMNTKIQAVKRSAGISLKRC